MTYIKKKAKDRNMKQKCIGLNIFMYPYAVIVSRSEGNQSFKAASFKKGSEVCFQNRGEIT